MNVLLRLGAEQNAFHDRARTICARAQVSRGEPLASMSIMNLPKKILVPIDFSTPAHEAFDYALGLAAHLGANLTLMHACRIPAGVLYSDTAYVAASEITSSEARVELDAYLDKAKAKGVQASAVLEDGAPRERILAVAESTGADLIVMGTHGRRPLSRVLLGSVAEHVVRHARQPVLTVHGPSGA